MGKLTLNDIKPFLVNAKVLHNGQIQCGCPLCETGDKKPHHLYIKNIHDELVVYCQKCNASGSDIIKAFRELGATHEETSLSVPKTLVEDYVHIYKNLDGSVAYCKRRQKYNDGSKRFSFYYLDDTGNKVWTKPANCNVLYNLDLLSQAEESTPLYIVEGEKCADRLVEAGMLATTSNTGASKQIKFTDTDKAILDKFKTKIVITDNDDKGVEYANAWAGVRVLRITDVWKDAPPKADIADYIELGKPINVIKEFKFFDLDVGNIQKLNTEEIISDDFFNAICALQDELERKRVLALAGQRASELKIKRAFDNMYKAFLLKFAKNKINHGNTMSIKNSPADNLCCGDYVVDMTGIYKPIQTDEGEYTLDKISSMPIVPTAILRNVESGTEKIALSYFRDDVWTTVNVPRSFVANNTKIIELSDLGVDVNSGTAKDLVRYLSVVINSNDNSKLPRIDTVSHLGWVGESFVPYCDTIKTDVGAEFSDVVAAMETPKGDLEEWKRFVGELRKDMALRLTLDASLASPLVQPLNALPFMVHLWGASGSGKSIALMVSASVWGNPTFGKLVKSLNNTQNYMLNQLTFMQNLPFFGDELQTIRSVDGYDKLVMKICEGVDRGRLDRSALAQRLNSWANITITTGEEPCTMDNSGGGTLNRVIEIECGKKIVEDGNAVSNFVKNNYGTFGRVWIERCKDTTLMQEYKDFYGLLIKDGRMTDKQAMAMALLIMVDYKANKMFPVQQETLGIDDVIQFTKTKEQVDVVERAWQFLLSTISEHNANFITESGTICSNVVWGKYNRDRPNILYFNNTILARVLSENGFNLEACKKQWAAQGRLQTYAGKFTSPQYINGNSRSRCVTFDISK